MINARSNPKLIDLLAGALGGAMMLFLGACGTGFEEAVLVEEPIEAAPLASAEDAAPLILTAPPVVYPRKQRTARAGVLTAGDIDDTLNLAAFSRYARGARAALGLPLFDMRNVVQARLTGPDGAPAPGVRVTLRRAGTAEPFYSGYSGVDGMVTVFPRLFGQRGGGTIELRAFPEAQGQPVAHRLTPGRGRQVVQLPFAGGWSPDFLDLVFVVDTTGSMADELDWLTRELRRITRHATRAAPGADIRLGLVLYRDQGDIYVVRNLGFTDAQAQARRWLQGQRAGGGGDYPEAADAALTSAVALNWRRGRGERLLFHIADAPPHARNAKRYLNAARLAAQKGVQIFGLGASGVGAESEFLMRQAAVQSGGRYLFLTDDSGVGHAHAEPTISCYRVTRLTGLVERVLASELTGRRQEADPGAVIRDVGSYRNGVCLD